MQHRLSRATCCVRVNDRIPWGRSFWLTAALLAALSAGQTAHAVTSVSIDNHTDPVTLTVGETVTIHFDVAKAGGAANYRWARDLTGTGQYDPALPVFTVAALTDGGGGDTDPAPGKVTAALPIPPTMPAGRYIFQLQDTTDNTTKVAPTVWTVIPGSQPQAITGRVLLGPGGATPGSPPPDAIIWAYADLRTPVANTNIRPDGSYTLPVPPGRYIVFAEWFGNLRSQRQLVTVNAGQAVGGIDHQLAVGQEVQGVLRDDTGKPLPDAPVEAAPTSGAAITTRSFADGSYLLVLPAGKWRLSARGMEKVVMVADQPLDGVDFSPAPTGTTPPAAGTILTVAGNGFAGLGGEGGPARTGRLDNPQGLALDRAGNLYIAENTVNRIHKVDAATGILTTAAGNTTVDAIRFLNPFGSNGGFSGDGGPATAAQLNQPQHVAVDTAGNLYISDLSNNRVRRVDVNTGVITTIVGSGPTGNGNGSYSGDGGPATAATLNAPQSLVVDATGNLYIGDNRNGRVRKVSPVGIITTVAGGGKNPVTDGADALAVTLGRPRNLALDGQGNLFIWDGSVNRVLKLRPDGKLSFYAGNGTAGYSGDGGPATAAQLNADFLAMAVDSAGSLFVVDRLNNRVRKIGADGVIMTVAGSGPTGLGNGGYSGDSGPATAAQLNGPIGVAIDAAGNLYIADVVNKRIRQVVGVAAPGLVAGQ
jgi:sugar lactone lactonase YvrE